MWPKNINSGPKVLNIGTTVRPKPILYLRGSVFATIMATYLIDPLLIRVPFLLLFSINHSGSGGAGVLGFTRSGLRA